MRSLALCLALAAGSATVALPAAAGPSRDGAGEVALLVGGRFAEARVLALDVEGRTLAAGREPGTVHRVSICPGGRRSAEVVEREPAFRIAIRELPSLRLVRHFRIPDWNQDPFACVDDDGRSVALFFGSGPDLERDARLIRLTGAGARTLWRGTAWYASFATGTAFVQALHRTGTTIVAVDLRTAAVRRLGTVPVHGVYELTPNAAGTRLAGDAYEDGSGDPRLVVFDLARRPISARTIPAPLLGSTAWLSNDRFAYARDAVSIFSASLRRTGSIRGWRAGHATVLGSTLYGLRFDGARHRGKLIAAAMPSGPVRVVRHLWGEPLALAAAP